MELIDKISPKILREFYWGQKMSSHKIAGMFNCHQATIIRQLRKYGIIIRTNSEARKLVLKINIPRKKLKNLYLNQKASSPEIAKTYHCTPGTIRRLLRKYGIKIRTKSEAIRLLYNINIPRKELAKLYLERKMSSTEIAKKFNCSPASIRERLRECRIPIRSHYEAHLLCNKPQYARYDFSGNREEKAYLIGFCYGDLHAELTSPRSINVSMHSTKPNQVRLFEQLFSKYGHVWKGEPDEIKAISMHCYLNNTFSFLLKKKDLILGWILGNRKYFTAFLAGYTDAEGTFCIYNGEDGNFSIRSQDKNILHQIQNKLIKFGVLCRPPHLVRKAGTKDIRGTISNKDIFGLWIYRKDALLKLIDLLKPYLKHADKRRRMEIVKNNVLERNQKYNNLRDTFWYKLYLKEGVKPCQAIPTLVQ